MSGEVFYPSVVARLYWRFDESLHLIDTPLPAALAEGTYLPGLPPKLTTRPLLAQTGVDNLSGGIPRIPKQASVELSGYRQAGKWSLTLDYRDFPVDPRLCRAVAAEIHVGTVRASDFSDGMVRYKQDGGRRSILETRIDGVMREDTLAIFGMADLVHSEWSDSGATLRLEGRDLRGVFLDAPARPDLFAKLRPYLSDPINQVVARVIGLHPFGIGVSVEVNDDDWPNSTIPSPGSVQDLSRVNLGAAGVSPGIMPPGDPARLSVWDVVTQYCLLVGAVPYFVGQVLHIRPARSLYSHFKTSVQGDPAQPTPFQGGGPRTVSTASGTERLAVRRLVYGKDIGSLEFERKLSGIKVPQVMLVSHNTSSSKRGLGRRLEAVYPPSPFLPPATTEPQPPEATDEQGPNAGAAADAATQAATRSDVAPGGQVHRQTIIISVPGIRSRALLERLARDIWEEIARGEMGGKVATKTLTSFGGSAQDPDLLYLRPGDPVEILIDSRAVQSQPPLANTVTDVVRRAPFEQAVEELARRLGDENLARVLVATARNQVQELQSFFRVSNVRFGWDSTSGIDLQFDFQNFIEARYDLDKQEENRSPSKKIAAPGPRG